MTRNAINDSSGRLHGGKMSIELASSNLFNCQQLCVLLGFMHLSSYALLPIKMMNN